MIPVLWVFAGRNVKRTEKVYLCSYCARARCIACARLGKGENLDTLNAIFASQTWIQPVLKALVILLATWLAERVLTRGVWRFLKRSDNEFATYSIVVNILKACIWIVGISSVLGYCFGVDVSGIVTALGVGGIAVSLGFQDTIANLIGGIQISFMRLFKPGDRVLFGNVLGRVVDVTWRQTTLVNQDGNIQVVPNSVMNTQTFIKYPDTVRLETLFSVKSSHIGEGQQLSDVLENVKARVEVCVAEVEPLVEDTLALVVDSTAFAYSCKIVTFTGGLRNNEDISDAAMRAIAEFDFI